MEKVYDIYIQPYYAAGKIYTLTNAAGVRYWSSDLDALIRFFVEHTQQKAVSITSNQNETRT